MALEELYLTEYIGTIYFNGTLLGMKVLELLVPKNSPSPGLPSASSAHIPMNIFSTFLLKELSDLE